MEGFVLSLFGASVIGLIIDVFNSSNNQTSVVVNFVFNLVVLLIIITPIINIISKIL